MVSSVFLLVISIQFGRLLRPFVGLQKELGLSMFRCLYSTATIHELSAIEPTLLQVCGIQVHAKAIEILEIIQETESFTKLTTATVAEHC